jgi:NADPH:quinone reductase-like Zn-dependent oxidoreductase
VRELGADDIVDYGKTELVSIDDRFDVIFDVFGNYHFEKLKHLLGPRGTYVHTIPSSRIFKDVARTFVRRRNAKLVVVKSRRVDLDWLRQHIDAGRLRVVVDRSFALDDAAEAHRYMETKRARGKVVLAVD